MTSPAVAGVVSLADAGVASLANLAGGVTVGVASLADAGVSSPASPANLAGGFIVGVASPVVAGVAPLVDAGMASLADLVGGSPSECSLCSLLGSPLWDDGPPWTSSGDIPGRPCWGVIIEMTSPAVAGVVSLADAGVASPANLAGGFIIGVASPVVAGVAPLVDAGMASLADLVGGSPSECSLCSLLGSPLWDDGPPWTSSGDLINSVVHTSGPNSPDGPSDTDRLHRTGPGLRSTVLFVSRPDGSGGPCEEDSPPQTGSDTPLHCGVRILPPGPCGPGVKDDDISESTVANAPGMHLLCA